eukprot:scaffold4054_cov142-Skeletonema_menzelii.AAC.18
MMPRASPIIRCTMQGRLAAAFGSSYSRSGAVSCNSSITRLFTSTRRALVQTGRSNSHFYPLNKNLISLQIQNSGISSGIHSSFILFPPSCTISNSSTKTFKRGFASGGKKSDFVVSKFDNTLKSLRELHNYVKTHLSLDIWALNIILVAFVFGPTVWTAMREAPHDDDDYAFSIPVDDPVEHSVRILMESTGSNEQRLHEKSEPNIKSRKSGSNNDKTTIISPEEDAKRILNDLLGSDNVKSTASRVASNVIQSPPFQNAVKALVKNVWNDLINDPETSTQLTSLVQSVLQNERIYAAVKELLMQLLNDEEVYDELTKLVVQLGEERDVLNATQKLLTVSAHATLNDPDVLDHSMEFATEVVGDDVVQRTGGEALRNTVGYAVQPSGGAMLAGLGTMVIAGVLHFYFSRGSYSGSSSTGNSSASDRTDTLLSQPSSSSLDRSTSASSISWTPLLQKFSSILLSLNGAITTLCTSGWDCVVSYKMGNTAISMYNTLHWLARSWRHIVFVWRDRSSMTSDC